MYKEFLNNQEQWESSKQNDYVTLVKDRNTGKVKTNQLHIPVTDNGADQPETLYKSFFNDENWKQ
jgi:hypothetical protein